MRFYEQLANEILGLYTPGRSPLIYASKELPAESIHFHELAHRKLCSGTTFGRLTQSLSTAINYVESELSEQLKRCILKCCNISFLTQEGCAISYQLAMANASGRVDLAEKIIATLTPSYQKALDKYPWRIVNEFSHPLARDYPQLKHILPAAELETAAVVIGCAAMSIPICEAIRNSSTLPSIPLNVILGKSSPDTRLNEIQKIVTKKHLKLWLETIHSTESVQSRELQINKVVEDLCAEAGLPFENPQEFDDMIELVLRKCGVNNPLRLVSLAGKSNSDLQMMEAAAHVISKYKFTPDSRIESLDVALSAVRSQQSVAVDVLRNAGQDTSNLTFAIVAEMPIIQDSTLEIFLNSFVQRNGLGVYCPRNRGAFILNDVSRSMVGSATSLMRVDAALYLGTAHVRLSLDDLEKLEHSFSVDWAWVVEAMFASQLPKYRFAKKAQIYLTGLETQEWTLLPIKAICDASNSSWGATLAENASLHLRADKPTGLTYASVSAYNLCQLNSNSEQRSTTFLESCVTETLMCGAASIVIERLNRNYG